MKAKNEICQEQINKKKAEIQENEKKIEHQKEVVKSIRTTKDELEKFEELANSTVI